MQTRLIRQHSPPTLPNFAQLILGSGERLQSDEVVTYSDSVGVHLQSRGKGGTHRQSVRREEDKTHMCVHTHTRTSARERKKGAFIKETGHETQA
jgi:hypothetical protein